MITEELKNGVKKPDMFEKYREEIHSNERIDESCSPVDFFNSLKESVQVRYPNLVISKNKKIPKLIYSIKKWKIIGGLIQFLAFIAFVYLILMLSVFKDTLLDYPRYNWDEGLYMAYIIFCVFSPVLFLIIGGFVRIIGRKPFAEYIEVWNPLKAPMEIVRLSDGKVAILSYMKRTMEKGSYLKAVNRAGEPLTAHPIWDDKDYMDEAIVKYCYVIDKISSLKNTKDGFEITSSGKYYGLRVAGYCHNRHRSSAQKRIPYYLWTECNVTQRKEIIPTIFEKMEYLYIDLQNLFASKY